MRFDVSPSGMRQTGAHTTGKQGELDGDAQMLRSAVDQAGQACAGPLTEALMGLSNDVSQTMRGVSARIDDLVSGANQAVGAYDQGDQEMSRNATHNQGQGNFSAARFSSRGGQ